MNDSNQLRNKIERHLNTYSMKPLNTLIFSSPPPNKSSLHNSRVQSPNTSSHSTRSNFYPSRNKKSPPQININHTSSNNQLSTSPQTNNPLAQSTGNFLAMTPGSGNSLNNSQFNNYSTSPARGLYESLLRDNLSDVKSRGKYSTLNGFYKPSSIEPKRKTKAFLKDSIKDELDDLLTEQLSFHTIKIENLVSRKILAEVPKEMSSYLELLKLETEKLVCRKVRTLSETLREFIESKFRFFGCLASDEAFEEGGLNFLDNFEDKAFFFTSDFGENEEEDKNRDFNTNEKNNAYFEGNSKECDNSSEQQERNVMKEYEER